MGLLDKAKDALNSDKGEELSDQAIDRAKDFASEKTGGKFDDQIDQAGHQADQFLGNE